LSIVCELHFNLLCWCFNDAPSFLGAMGCAAMGLVTVGGTHRAPHTTPSTESELGVTKGALNTGQ